MGRGWGASIAKFAQTDLRSGLTVWPEMGQGFLKEGMWPCVYKAQVRSVMEYASLSWMSASPTTLGLLDSIQKKALRIIGTSEEKARTELNISSLHQRRQVAAATVLYKMHTNSCPPDLKAMLPKPFVARRATRSSLSMPGHAFTVPVSRTVSTCRTFFYSTVQVWNSLPDSVVGDISDNGAQSFKCRVHQYLTSCA
ncbi:reverse transcriptase [Apostichopus japonicus]|uniref:Reverse transcriptase n=2 Tax=Stichopus japonicus TaxID=307972 RepID=A0A2G8KRG4_STIJA|nr:reverse transcriptase [Apostichopus japonicus]